MIEIAGRPIGMMHSPFIIAEMSGNHNRSLQRALLIWRRQQAGAHALKLQTYTADTITMNSGGEDFIISNQDSPWAGQKLFELYDKAHTPWEWHAPIMKKGSRPRFDLFQFPF